MRRPGQVKKDRPRQGAASNSNAIGEPLMRLKAQLSKALLGPVQATGDAGDLD